MIRFEDVPVLLGPMLLGPIPGDWPEGEIASIEEDSRRIHAPGLFGCIQGTQQDGRTYVGEAVARGARAAFGLPPVEEGLPFLPVREPRKAIAILSARMAHNPSERLDMVGITGTNGKTTTSWILQSIWERCGIPAAVLGTLGSGRPGALRATSHTTPDAPRFQSLLHDLVDEGYKAVSAEVSSHSLDQDRTYATRFRGVVFTNLTRDHLDYHGTFDAYRQAKRKLFDRESRGDDSVAIAVVNLDDPLGAQLARETKDRLVGYGTSPEAEVRLRSITTAPDGGHLDLTTREGGRRLFSPLIGEYNGWNLLAAYATALAIGLPIEEVESGVARGITIPGRMETIDAGQPFLVLVDYAHTPDALERALLSLRPLTQRRLHVLFGCGGDRDPGKRAPMGRIAARLADRIILTSDNPRSEDPGKILEAIELGVRLEGRSPDSIEVDRQDAIRQVLEEAADGDVVLLAGKGHEDYQETASGRRPFDDRQVASQCLRAMKRND